MTELLAAYAADKLGGKGDVAMLSGPSGLDLTLFRVNGFKDYLSKFPGIKVVAEKFTSTSSADALTTMQDFLQSQPDLKAVYAFNGPIAIGAVQALRAAGKNPGDVLVLTTDMEDETKRLIDEGWIQATIVSQPVTMARLAVQRAVEAAEGKTIPKETLTQATMITKATADGVDLSGQTVPADWK
jgi:ABC-type sugar transport system substrate-binding protein